jgi:PEP-CTERM motif
MRYRHVERIVLWSALIAVAAAPEAQADFVTSLSGNVTPISGAYEYDYTLTNSSQSTVSAYVFALSVDAGADLQSIVIPTGWDVTYNVGDASIIWSAPSDLLAVAPGLSAAYGFISAEPPLTGNYDVTGFDPDQFQFYDNPGTTFVPGISSVPEPSTLVLLGFGGLAVIGYSWFRARSRCHSWRRGS